MNNQEVFYSTLLFGVGLISIVVAVIVGRRRTAPGGWALVIYLLALAWWSITYALYWARVYPSGHFWLDVTYVGVVTVAPSFFIFVLQITHRENWLNGLLLTLLIVQPVLTLMLLWTDQWHGLFFAGQRSTSDSTIFAGGPWFWINVIFGYSLVLFGVLLLGKSFIAARALYRRQIGLILLAVFIPWGINFVSLLHLNPLPALDLTPVAFTLTGLFIAFTLLQYRLLDIVPIARDKLIENMKDGILVVDNQDRVVDVNPALQDLLNVKISSLIGQGVAGLLPEWAQLQAAAGMKDMVGQEIVIQGSPAKCLNVRLIRLRDRQKNDQGKLLILQDVTAKKQLESDREALILSLQDALGQVKTLKGLLPICANCKKIRDDQGYWQDVVVYIRNHTEAEFSHGICPDCLKRLYPEYYDKSQ